MRQGTRERGRGYESEAEEGDNTREKGDEGEGMRRKDKRAIKQGKRGRG